MTKVTLVIGGVILLGVGHISGQYFQSWAMKRRLLKVLPLVEKSLVDIITKGIDNGFDEEEMKIALRDDFQFITIMMGEK